MVIARSPLDSAIISRLREDGLLREGHFRYESGRHGTALLDRDRLLADPRSASQMGYALAKAFFTDKIDTVAAPSIWGGGLAQWVAYFLEPRAKVVYSTRSTASGSCSSTT
jgi:orotate phosphoribosyltransferase